MSTSAQAYLHHIINEARYLMEQTQGLGKDEFLDNETLKRAFVRSLEVIGEATKQVPDGFKQKYSYVEWRAMAGMRDRLIHGYFGVDYEVVWDAVTNNVPALNQEIEEILRSEGTG
jgi:uncharacterized protein with HEPN domain